MPSALHTRHPAAPKPNGGSRFNAWRQVFGVEPGQDEEIQRPTGPCGVRHRRYWRPTRRRECPVRCILGTLLNPIPQNIDLIGIQSLMPHGCRGHAEDRIGGLDAPEEFAGAGVSWTNGSAPGCRGRQSGRAKVEPQTCLTLRSVGPMAKETTIGQKRLDVASKVNRLGARHRQGERETKTSHPECLSRRRYPEHGLGPFPGIHYARSVVKRSPDVPLRSGPAAGGVQYLHAYRQT